MLSRGLSNASNRPVEPRPLTFVQTRSLAPQEHYGRDFEPAHKEAIAAASFAFERASERALASQGIKESNIGPAASIDEQVEMGQRLRRKQSIRFTGLTAVPIRNCSITRRIAPQSDDLSSPPNAVQNGPHATGGYSPVHRVSSARTSPQSTGSIYKTHVSSSSKSLRKLKRARSMCVLRDPTAYLFGNNRPPKTFKVQQISASLRNEYSQRTDVTESRLQRSFSFLRGDKDHVVPALDMQKKQSAVTQIAREQYLRELEEKRLKENCSSLAPSHSHKSQRAFRKSVRSSSTNDCGDAVASQAEAPKESAPKKGLGHKARSLSFSLKQKLRQVFLRSSYSEKTLPIQQLDASRLHFGEHTSNYARPNQEYHQIPSPDSEILRKARSRESSLSRVPDFPERVSPTKSIRSVPGEDGASPLFAIWASPSPENMFAASQFREKKRLSVIQEHGGPHQPSSSGHNYVDLGNVFHAPIKSSGTGKQMEEFVDSQKMYSALRQKIDENRRLAQSNKYFWEQEEVDDPLKTNTSKVRRASPSIQTFTGIPVRGPSPDHSIGTSNLVAVDPIRISRMNDDMHSTQDRPNDYGIQGYFLEGYTSLTPQEIAVQNEINDIFPKRPLREMKASFSPSLMRIERTNISPYRRPMSSGGDNETGANSELEENTPLRVRSESAFGSASIYSRTSSGNTPKNNKSSASLTKSETSDERSKSVVVRIVQSPYEESLAPLTPQSEIPKQSENDQVWMEAELSQSSNREVGDIQNFSAAGKENRHKMESAQIDDDDMDVGRLRDDTQMKKQSAEISLENAKTQPSLRNHTSRSIFSRSPLLEIGQCATQGRSERCSSSSPCQPSTPQRFLHLDQRMSSFKREMQGSEMPGRTASNGTLKSQGSDPLGNRGSYVLRRNLSVSTESIRMDTTQDMQESPTPPIRAVFQTNKAAKPQGYKSPERLARIRRLQSRNSLASHKKCQVESNIGELESEQDDGKELIGPAFKNPSRIAGFPKQSVSNMAFDGAQSTEIRSVVDSFLRTTRTYTKVDEDNGNDPAFL